MATNGSPPTSFPLRPDYADPQHISQADEFLEAVLWRIEQPSGLRRRHIGDRSRITNLLDRALALEDINARHSYGSVDWNLVYIIDRARWRARELYDLFVALPAPCYQFDNSHNSNAEPSSIAYAPQRSPPHLSRHSVPTVWNPCTVSRFPFPSTFGTAPSALVQSSRPGIATHVRMPAAIPSTRPLGYPTQAGPQSQNETSGMAQDGLGNCITAEAYLARRVDEFHQATLFPQGLRASQIWEEIYRIDPGAAGDAIDEYIRDTMARTSAAIAFGQARNHSVVSQTPLLGSPPNRVTEGQQKKSVDSDSKDGSNDVSDDNHTPRRRRASNKGGPNDIKGNMRVERITDAGYDPVTEEPLGKGWLFQCDLCQRGIRSKRDFHDHMRYSPHDRKERVPNDEPTKKQTKPNEEWGFIVVKVDQALKRWQARDHLRGDVEYVGDFIHEKDWKSSRGRKTGTRPSGSMP